ncbi:MAG: rRNA maturation RNase YbeY [Puniceicoccales bacterium]|jgi:probable rRNA maturation factor|nr:rRNA maturation RNase YbeY [Puniceicoccales bacterium]
MRRTATHIEKSGELAGFRAAAASVSRLFVLLDTFPKHRLPPGDLSVAFLGDAAICRLHADFLGDPSPTDVITFPGAADDTSFAGEICVCVPRARREAPKFGNSLASELLLYLVHGWLHLTGLDDIAPSDRALMRTAERETLAFLHTAAFVPNWGDKTTSSAIL